MTNIYYTATTGRRNNCGHVTTRGTVYVIKGIELENIGDFVHQSGGADISRAVLDIAEKHGIDTNGGYCKGWREVIEIIEL